MTHLYWVWYFKKYQPYSRNGKHFRKIPVPHTRCYRGGGYSYFKHPKTRQEQIENIYLDRDEEARYYGVKLRRSRAKLPNSYWDIGRGDYGNDNWKRYRKHQWKE